MMTFAEWLNSFCGTDFELNKNGGFDSKKNGADKIIFYQNLCQSHLMDDYNNEKNKGE